MPNTLGLPIVPFILAYFFHIQVNKKYFMSEFSIKHTVGTCYFQFAWYQLRNEKLIFFFIG